MYTLQMLTPEGIRHTSWRSFIAPTSTGALEDYPKEAGFESLAHPSVPESETPPEHAALESYAAELTPTRLRDAYRHMVLTRAFDQAATNLQRQGELGLWASCLGQEAAQVGSALATAPTDMVFPSYREHAVAQVRGLPLTSLLPVFRGTRHGGWDPAAYNFHLYTFVIAAHMPHAVGYATALTLPLLPGVTQPRPDGVVVYTGDGSTSQGDFNEALVFAASAQAPIVTVIQNNQWAISVPTHVQSRVPLAQRAAGFGIPHLRVDGNDVIATYAATRHALEHIHAGRGPFLIEAVTYRRAAHTTSDDPSRYRPRAEEEAWAARDPIDRLARYLSDDDPANFASFQAEVAAAGEQLAMQAREFARANTAGEFAEVFAHVYGAPHAQLEAELAAWRAEVADAPAATTRRPQQEVLR